MFNTHLASQDMAYLSQPEIQPRSKVPTFTPLERETRAVLPTPEAAYHLNRAQQTLRLWAMYENGPIRPLRVNGRLAWPVADIRRILQVESLV